MKAMWFLKGRIITQDGMEFLVYMIQTCVNEWNPISKQVYYKLSENSCVD